MLFFMASEIRAQSRQIFTLQKDWKFIKGNPEKASETNFDASSWQDVIIPHDWAISEPFIIDGDGNTGKLPWKGEGWYRKKLEIPSSYKNKRIILIFDGVMAFPKVYINGKLAGEWDYGYNSFHIEVTDYVNFGVENILAVHADTRKHDSRWYPGGGIYRKVQLLVVNPIHVAVWGTYITTPIVKPNYADVRINTSVQNQSATAEEIKVEQVILNSKGVEVAKASILHSILSESAKDFEVTAQLTNPVRWDIDNPVLYKAVTTIYKNDEVIDTYSTSFGIRTIQFTADDGFHLNERRVQLKGVNLHSDFGPLGVAFNSRAMERQLEIMKSMGVNAIRNSHNVAAPELLELCDKMGILVFN
jgi:beta-galactosidase